MTDDAEAPDRLYEWTAKETIDRLRKVIEGQGLSMQAMIRELGEARAKVSELGIALNDARAGRLSGPIREDVGAQGRRLADRMIRSDSWTESWTLAARALQAYGDERAREGVSYEAAGNAVGQVLEAERVRCEQIVDAVRDEQRRIADARVARVRRELGGLAPTDEYSWGWG